MDRGWFWLSDTPNIVSRGWDVIGCHRMVIWVKLRELKTGVEFHFFNAHYGFSDECQMKSAKLILDHFKPLGVRTFFITGDFNMFNHSPAYKYMSKTVRNMNELLENDLYFTFHGYCPERHGHETPIDFCFITPHTVEPISYRRITETIEGKYPSDHYGLELALEVKQAVELLALDGTNLYPADEKKAGSQIAWLRRTMFLEGKELVAVRGAGDLLKENLAKNAGYACVFGETAAPIYYKEELFDLMESLPIGEDTGLAILKHKNTGKVFGLLNAGNPAMTEKVKATLSARAELPVVCIAGGEMRFGNADYRTLREALKDLRIELDPQNVAPTFKGDLAEMKEPGICDFALYRGEGIAPVAYELSKTVNRQNFSYSAHEAMMISFTI